MYFEDLTPYSYSSVRTDGDAAALLNFGWLDAAHDFPRAEPPAWLADCTLRMATASVAATRGFHQCPFCPATRDQPVMLLGDRRVYLGSAEIRCTAGDATYAAPNLVAHYIAAHRYQPPGEVLDALEQHCRDGQQPGTRP